MADRDPPTPSTISIGAGLPPVPLKLATRIHAWEFIEMAELLPDRMGVTSKFESEDERDKLGRKPKRRQVTNILEWVQCFGIYVAVIAEKHPKKVRDLLGYQALILEANMEYEGGTWLGYDRRFRLSVAGNPDAVWAHIDPTLWNMAFTGHAKAKRCRYCFSLTHLSSDCDLAPTTVTTQAVAGPSNSRGPKTPRICLQWNYSSDAQCPYPGCKYLHICLRCAQDPTVQDKQHKASHCPKRFPASAKRAASAQPLFPAHGGPSMAPARYRPY